MSFAWVEMALTLATTTPSRESRTAVLPIVVGGALTPSMIAAAVDEAARLRPTLRVLPLDEYFLRDGGAVADRVRDCGSDVECIAREVGGLDADLAIVVVAIFDRQPPLVTTIGIDIASRSVLRQRTERLPSATSETLRAHAASLFDDLGHLLHARLEVEVEPKTAQVRVDAATPPDPGTHTVFTLEAGRHSVTASCAGHRDATRDVDLVPGQTHSIAMALEPIPISDSPWFWPGMASGIATVVITAAVAMTVVLLKPRPKCVCIAEACGLACE
jgi:hypothetical protein